MKKPLIFIEIAVLALIALYFSWYLWVGPYMHNQTLKDFSNELFAVELPNGSTLLDTTSLVGQQVGNGDHCDYLAAIQLQTELTKEDLEKYFRDNYSGNSEVQFAWLNEENPYTASTFDPLVTFTLRDWIKSKVGSNPTSVVIYIFESGMTSAVDYRCS